MSTLLLGLVCHCLHHPLLHHPAFLRNMLTVGSCSCGRGGLHHDHHAAWVFKTASSFWAKGQGKERVERPANKGVDIYCGCGF